MRPSVSHLKIPFHLISSVVFVPMQQHLLYSLYFLYCNIFIGQKYRFRINYLVVCRLAYETRRSSSWFLLLLDELKNCWFFFLFPVSIVSFSSAHLTVYTKNCRNLVYLANWLEVSTALRSIRKEKRWTEKAQLPGYHCMTLGIKKKEKSCKIIKVQWSTGWMSSQARGWLNSREQSEPQLETSN